MILAKDGNFYGTNIGGGANNLGMIIRLTKSGMLTTVASMDANTGEGPLGIIEAIDGNFYGVTRGRFLEPGGVFQLTPGGVLSSMFRFNEARGTDPVANLMQASDGHLYGTTAANGPSRAGVIYRVKILPRKQLLNISTRLRVQTGENVLIGGFIITGTDPKRVIIRGIGPSLSGVGPTLLDPTLELYQGSTTLSTNDNWKEHQAEIEATTIQPTNDLESAIVMTLVPGAYTAILADKNGANGVGVVEVYDLTTATNSQLANISSRGFVDTGDNVMIGGLIVGGGTGPGSARVLVRALGPSLNNSGIQEALPDTTLELHSENGATIASNDNWKDTQQADIEATTIPPANNLESAIVSTLAPGNYTAVVRGKGNATGVGLVEVYNLP